MRHSTVPLEITPIEGDPSEPNLPFHFDIAIGVRQGDEALKDSLDAELVRRRAAIQQILTNYGIPQFDEVARTSRVRED
jgi:mxaJ protein